MTPQIQRLLSELDRHVRLAYEAGKLTGERGSKIVECIATLRKAIETSDRTYEEALSKTTPPVRRGGDDFLRQALERAWVADPGRTEYELMMAGFTDLARDIGAWYLSEQHRANRSEAAAE